MAYPYNPPGFPPNAFPVDVPLMSFNEPDPYHSYPMFLGPGQYSEGVAVWHSHPVQAPSMSTINGPAASQKQGPVDQKKHKRTRSGCYTCRSRRVKVCVLNTFSSVVTYLIT